MGVVKGISRTEFPKQHAKQLHRAVQVCFNYEHDNTIGGVIVRDDAEAPHELIIRLDDGRYVRGVECQYTFGTKEELV